MKRILIILLNPFLLSLWVTILVLFVFPVHIRKFEAKILEGGSFLSDEVVRYDDLDEDGNSEKILICRNSLGNAGITVSSPDGFLRQWALRGNFDFVLPQGTIITGDRDGNGIKEIYIFTLLGDSVLLHCIPDFRKPDSVWMNKFVAKCGKSDNKVDPFIVPAEIDDLTGDGSGELIFGIGTGYSLFPRRVFAYDQVKDTFLASPASGYYLSGILQRDVNGDNRKELIPYGYATGNITDSSVPFSDQKVWLMVLDQDLHFLFDPVSFSGVYTLLMPFVFTNQEGKPVLAALHRPPENLGDTAQLYYFNTSGRITNKILLPGNTIFAYTNTISKGKGGIILLHNQSVELYDEKFQKIRTIQEEINGPILLIDIDQDGINELIINNIVRKQIIIYRSDLKYPLIIPFDGIGRKGIVFSIKKNGAGPSGVFIQMGSHYLQFLYKRNHRYNFRFGIYGTAYLSIFLFTLLVRKIQDEQLRKKQETQRKIADLQLQIVRNQLDPHFIMNAVNSIIASITDKNKEVVRQQLLHFSKMHRSLLLSSDRIMRSLEEEIDFTANYLALEKFRFKERFNYTVEIDPSVNRDIQVPKMVLQIHVENALKHGLLLKDKGGLISVKISTEMKSIIIEISDNGAGRDFAKKQHCESTGKGLAVMDQFSALFNKHHTGKINTEISDIFDATGNPGGTHVKIVLTEFL